MYVSLCKYPKTILPVKLLVGILHCGKIFFKAKSQGTNTVLITRVLYSFQRAIHIDLTVSDGLKSLNFHDRHHYLGHCDVLFSGFKLHWVCWSAKALVELSHKYLKFIVSSINIVTQNISIKCIKTICFKLVIFDELISCKGMFILQFFCCFFFHLIQTLSPLFSRLKAISPLFRCHTLWHLFWVYFVCKGVLQFTIQNKYTCIILRKMAHGGSEQTMAPCSLIRASVDPRQKKIKMVVCHFEHVHRKN